MAQRNISRKRIAGLSRLVPSVVFMLSLAGTGIACKGFAVDQAMRGVRADWTAPTVTTTDEQRSDATLTPPLKLAWSYDVAGGVGSGPPIIIDTLLLFGNFKGELHAVNARTGRGIGSVGLTDAIHGSPALLGATAFVTGAYGKETIVAYDIGEGATIWGRSYGDVEVSPLVMERRVYFGNSKGKFYCLDAESGELAWSFSLPDNPKNKGIRSSAVADSSTVYFGAEDGAIYALDAASGARRWSFQTGAPINTSPAVHNGTVYIGNFDGRFHAIDAATGVQLWVFNAGATIYAPARVSRDRVLVATASGAIFALHPPDGTLIWRTDLDGVVNAGPALSGDIMFVGTLNKELIALRITDGVIVWKQEVSGRIKTQPVAYRDRLYVITDDRALLSFVEDTP